MADFPAAHSMDTDWFAVDADGNVAIFNSSEGGAVPYFSQDFFNTTPVYDVKDFCTLLPRDEAGIVHLITEGKFLIKDINFGTIPISFYYDYAVYLVLIVSSREAIAKLKTSDNLVLHFAGEPVIIYVDQVPKEIINSMFFIWRNIRC